MTMDDGRERFSGKRDRLARLLRLVGFLQGHPEGAHPKEMAERMGTSVRTVYRDLTAIDVELKMPVWNDEGKWGIDSTKAFLPPLKLTQQEAMAVVISARLMVRYIDKYDPDLAAAFEKLEQGLPPALAEHVERTLDVLSKAQRDERFSENVHLLTKAWAERRVVTFDYAPARYEGGAAPRRPIVEPYLLEPSLQTHALYLIGFDVEKKALRTFKVERIGKASLMPQTFEPPDSATTTSALRAAWDIIADQPLAEIVLRFTPTVADRVRETTWHPTQKARVEPDGSLHWTATVSGTIEIRLWILSWGDDVEVLEPASLRDDVAATHRRAAARYAAAG